MNIRPALLMLCLATPCAAAKGATYGKGNTGGTAPVGGATYGVGGTTARGGTTYGVGGTTARGGMTFNFAGSSGAPVRHCAPRPIGVRIGLGFILWASVCWVLLTCLYLRRPWIGLIRSRRSTSSATARAIVSVSTMRAPSRASTCRTSSESCLYAPSCAARDAAGTAFAVALVSTHFAPETPRALIIATTAADEYHAVRR
jgi:hypothetical protein